MLPEKLQYIIHQLPQSIQLVVKMVVEFFEQRLAQKDLRIKELEDQLSKNSQNSSKPPSSDTPYDKPAPKSRREKTGKSVGGQKGHRGSNLKMTATPDEYVHHQVTTCTYCGADLTDTPSEKTIRRQVYDIPLLSVRVTEHRSQVKVCPCGCQSTNFPAGVSHYVQYGPRLKGLMVYLQNYQLLPYERTSELIEDLFAHRLSCGTLHTAQQSAYERLGDFEQALKTVLSSASMAGFDETGFRVLTANRWLHSCSTNSHAYYQVHEKRGSEAMDAIGILPEFKGIAIHDFWKSYLKYPCIHGLCNAHLLRELTFIEERLGEAWAKELMDVLLEMKRHTDEAVKENQTALSQELIQQLEQQYDKILQKALDAHSLSPPIYVEGQPKKRGRVKKSKQRNLLERLRDYKADIIRFCKDFRVPFDNNFSERDIRMMKLKQKISGCFRSWTGAKYFARIRSFIMSARKQNRHILDDLTDVFQDNIAWKQIVHYSYAE